MLKICLIKTGINSKKGAKQLAKALVDEGLAACVQISKGRSVYRWQGKTEVAKEYYLAIKTSPSHCNRVITKIQKEHPYELPEIICTEFETTVDYGNWVYGEVDASIPPDTQE